MESKNLSTEYENGVEQSLPLNSTTSLATNAPEESSRGAWDNKIQYMFMVISYAVGLGNVWRFPYLCQKHGGGAFLIPYLVMLFAEGMPLLYLELAIGQKFQKGSIGVWNAIHPYLGGIGIASAVVSLLLAIYYNAIITWCFFYLFNSFQKNLPWEKCPYDGNVTVEECDIAGPSSYYWYREALNISPSIEISEGINWKIFGCFVFAWLVVYCCVCRGIQSSGKLERLKDPLVWLDAAAQIFYSFGLAFGGLIAFASYNKPTNNCQTDAIVVSICNWLTAIYACLVIFSILGYKATLMFEHCLSLNAIKITKYFPHINMTEYAGEAVDYTTLGIPSDKLKDLALIKCDLQEDLNKAASGTGLAFIVFAQAIVEFGPSSPFWSFIFFLMLLALGLGTEFATLEGIATSIRDSSPYQWTKTKWKLSGKFLAAEGTGLAFIVFTQAILEFGDSAPFWSIIFFLMLLALGLGTEFATIEGVATSLRDVAPFEWMKKRWLLSGVLCLFSFVVGIVFTLNSGAYWVELFDFFSGTFALMIVALLEILAVSYKYGINNFCNDVYGMIGKRPNIIWRVLWKFIAPALILILLVSTIIMKFIDPVTYKAYNKNEAALYDMQYPLFASLIAGFLVLLPIVWLPGIALTRRFGMFRYEPETAPIGMEGIISSRTAFVDVTDNASECTNGRKSVIHATSDGTRLAKPRSGENFV
ncbi:sodium-dependent neutral amino acid transporter B(0)AT1 [Octopus bimaculoides]|uniref:sodium-dependent neutral amino acid transporter B(0)AT1 n=1 Tax=Octopus bimaculoides TaxID=37653 RepID=UPI0022E4FF24|nr:sodium-dependent neutral amino acid transporter B(0)AT1 [Octopus bimaculoides]